LAASKLAGLAAGFQVRNPSHHHGETEMKTLLPTTAMLAIFAVPANADPQISVRAYDLQRVGCVVDLSPMDNAPKKKRSSDWCDAIWVFTRNINNTNDHLEFDANCTAYDRAGRVLGHGSTSDEDNGDGRADLDQQSMGRSLVRIPHVSDINVASVECHAEYISKSSGKETPYPPEKEKHAHRPLIYVPATAQKN
jgi:hypothetical protein